MRMCVSCSVLRHIQALYRLKGTALEKFEMEKKNWRIYLTLPGHFLNIHLGHGATDHSFEIMLSDPEGRKTTSPRSNTEVYILCFTKMKNLRRAVNPSPE